MGLFRGMTSTWAREVPGYFFFFGGYEFSRYMMTPKGGDVDDMGMYLRWRGRVKDWLYTLLAKPKA